MNMEKFDEENVKTEEMDEETICGIGSFRPRWLQRWATTKVYFFLFSMVGIIQGSHYTYFIGILTTLEKRFAFNSKISNTLLLVEEFSILILGASVGYFGGKMHRPRVLAISMFLSAGCCLVSVFPYFIYGPAKHHVSYSTKNEIRAELCENEFKKEQCNADDRPPTAVAVAIFCISVLLKGFGNVAFYTVGLSYMDDNAKKKDTPVYFALFKSLRILGPLLGFLLSSAFLSLYENPFDDPGFGPDDPRWIGGWWIGFFFQAIFLFIFSFPLFLLPRRLPNHPKPKVSNDSTVNGLISQFSDLFARMKILIRNPIFIFLLINIASSAFGIGGHFILLPKYVENQFRMTASEANLYSEPAGIVSVMIATAIGGILIRKYRPKTKYVIAGMAISEAIAAVGYLTLMIPQCKATEMSNSGFDEEGFVLTNSCNVNCSCTTREFFPVCGPDGKTTYFSPCFAGCSIQQFPTSVGEKNVFENCACLVDPSGIEKTFTEGRCVDDSCWPQALAYIIIFPILQVVTNIFRVAYTLILLRSVDPEDKSMALGFFDGLFSLFGIIPFLMISGAVVDSMCLIWEKSCGETGNCWFYDMKKFNYVLHGNSAFFTAVGSLSLVATYFMHARVRSLYDEEEEKEESGKAENEMKSLNKCSQE